MTHIVLVCRGVSVLEEDMVYMVLFLFYNGVVVLVHVLKRQSDFVELILTTQQLYSRAADISFVHGATGAS